MIRVAAVGDVHLGQGDHGRFRPALRDLPDLVARFHDEAELGTVNRVDFDAGDSHRNGRSVAIVWFDNGVRVVYKPRPMRIDCHFQDMLRWLNDRQDFHPCSGLIFRETTPCVVHFGQFSPEWISRHAQ